MIGGEHGETGNFSPIGVEDKMIQNNILRKIGSGPATKYILNDDIDSSIYLKCLLCIAYKYKDNTNVLDDIYNLCCVMLKSPETFGVHNIIYIFKYLSKSSYKTQIVKKLELLSIDCDHDVAKSINSILENYSDIDNSKIIENFKNNCDSRIHGLFSENN